MIEQTLEEVGPYSRKTEKAESEVTRIELKG